MDGLVDFRNIPVDDPGALAEPGRDGPMGSDQPGGALKGFRFGMDETRVRPEVTECRGVWMSACRSIELMMKVGERPAGHEDVEGAPPESAEPPKMREQVLRDHQMPAFGRDAFIVVLGE